MRISARAQNDRRGGARRGRHPLPALASVALAALHLTSVAQAQAGPPYLTNDPGTPGNGNWELNFALVPAVSRGEAAYQIPQFDLNYGLGDRVQLTYEVPYVLHTGGGATTGGWGNGFPGVKWRFFDEGDAGWQVSTFPQYETGVGILGQQRGIGSAGPRFLLPFEASRKVGPIDVDVEAGYWFPRRGAARGERILGLVVGHEFTPRLELDAELYDDHAIDAAPQGSTWDVGGRYKLSRSFIALFMAGSTLSGRSNGEPEFFSYLGVQVLLSDYGLKWGGESENTVPSAAR
jgi:hypothetical protein